jgi:hypothetical protein
MPIDLPATQNRILKILQRTKEPRLRTIRGLASRLHLEERDVETAPLRLAAAKRVHMRREDGKEAWAILKEEP